MNIDGFSPASAFASGNINTSVLGNNANAANAGITGNASDALKDNLKTAFGDTLGQVKPSRECQTCKNRKYQDGSNEMVSFKSAAHISPNAAGTAVRAHENEHVANAYAKAAQGGGKVLQASVSLKTSICPECGRAYVSGGVTHTRISYPGDSNPYSKNLKSFQSEAAKGNSVDLKIS